MGRRFLATMLILAGSFLLMIGQLGLFGSRLLSDPTQLAALSTRIVTDEAVTSSVSDRVTDAIVGRLPTIDPVTDEPYTAEEIAQRDQEIRIAVNRALISKPVKALFDEASNTLVAKIVAGDDTPVILPTETIRDAIVAELVIENEELALLVPASLPPVIFQQGTSRTIEVDSNSPTVTLPKFVVVRNTADTLRNGGLASGGLMLLTGIILHPKRKKTMIWLGLLLIGASSAFLFISSGWIAAKLSPGNPELAQKIVDQLKVSFRWYALGGIALGVGVVFVGELLFGLAPWVRKLRVPGASKAVTAVKGPIGAEGVDPPKKMFFQKT